MPFQIAPLNSSLYTVAALDGQTCKHLQVLVPCMLAWPRMTLSSSALRLRSLAHRVPWMMRSRDCWRHHTMLTILVAAVLLLAQADWYCAC